jgi:hypothetical protein
MTFVAGENRRLKTSRQGQNQPQLAEKRGIKTGISHAI